MPILILRCANGIVAFRFADRSGPQGTFTICLNDNVHGFIPNGAGQPVIDALQQMFAHAVSLKGAIQQAVNIDI